MLDQHAVPPPHAVQFNLRSNSMSIKRHLSSVLSNAKSNAKRYAKRTIAEIGRNERNVDIYLRSILQDKKVLLNVNDAALYIDLMRACIEPCLSG